MVIDQPPIRYSVGQDDFDFEIGQRLLIRLDGVEQKYVTEYDCESGTLTRHKLSAEGKPQVEPGWDRVWEEILNGVVTVEFKDG